VSPPLEILAFDNISIRIGQRKQRTAWFGLLTKYQITIKNITKEYIYSSKKSMAMIGPGLMSMDVIVSDTCYNTEVTKYLCAGLSSIAPMKHGYIVHEFYCHLTLTTGAALLLSGRHMFMEDNLYYSREGPKVHGLIPQSDNITWL
jgi:hypothetical protein